jgi:hypothetical protein
LVNGFDDVEFKVSSNVNKRKIMKGKKKKKNMKQRGLEDDEIEKNRNSDEDEFDY